jgi:hypothetical protein
MAPSMAVAPPRAFQTTFQVTLRGGPAATTYHARRAHKKSRKGCLVCKQRRVKVQAQDNHLLWTGDS